MNTQIQRRPTDQLAGTFRDEHDLNARMQQAQEQCHLIAPASSVGRIPEGCGVALSVVSVDIQNDTYDVGMGKRGLSKHVLDKLSAALGVSWDPLASGRLDDGSDPRYVHWRAVGHYKSFDGQVLTIVGTKEMDLRPASPQVDALEERAKTKGKSAAAQVREMRLHIVGHAESKARLRAIRSLGIKTAYTADELRKPFLAARITWTGQTNSPELRMLFAEKTADAFLSGTSSLYGRQQSAQATAIHSAPRLASPPPVGTVDVDEDEYSDDERKSEPPARTQAQAKPAEQQSLPAGNSGGFTVPGGKEKGKALVDASDSTLAWWADTIGRNIETGQSRNVDRDVALSNAMRAELSARAGGAQSADRGNDPEMF